MPKMTIDDLESSMKAVRDAGQRDPKFLEEVNPRLTAIKEAFNFGAMDYCLERYIGAELDFKSSGDRGLGRISTEVPRLGAYFRKPMSKLDESELSELHNILQQIVLSGYLTYALVMEDPLKTAKLTGGSEIYEKWLPRVYSTDPSQTPEHLQGYMAAFSNVASERWTSFSTRHGMKGGGAFSQDKTPVILVYYIIGGFWLRATEVGA